MRTLEMHLDICSTDYTCWWPPPKIQVTRCFLGIETKSETFQVCPWPLSSEAETYKWRKVLFSYNFVVFLMIITHIKIKKLIWLPILDSIFWCWHSPLIPVLLTQKSNLLNIKNYKMKKTQTYERKGKWRPHPGIFFLCKLSFLIFIEWKESIYIYPFETQIEFSKTLWKAISWTKWKRQ